MSGGGCASCRERDNAVIDHIYLPVTDLARSTEFYTRVLGHLGWHVNGAYDAKAPPRVCPIFTDFKVNPAPASGCRSSSPSGAGTTSVSRPQVGPTLTPFTRSLSPPVGPMQAPGIRHYFSDGYYAGNVRDPDGHTLEFVHKG